jgi:CRP-like cAMP-binding protein
VLKVALKRADLSDLVVSDVALRSTAFVKALGGLAESVLKAGNARRYPDRAVLYQQGDVGSCLYFVLKGEVRLSGRKGADSVELGSAMRGDVFGEDEVLSGESLRTGTAVAQGDVDCAELPREALMQHGQLLREVAIFLKPIKAARQSVLSELTDFMNRW